MIKSTYRFRTRYSEIDQMGFVYYAHYATFFEVARVELFRTIGVSYKQLEEDNILLPVSEYKIKYLLPLLYDEEFEVKTTIKNLPSGSRIHFEYELFNAKNELCTKAETTLFFMDKIKKRPRKCPEEILEIMGNYF